MMFTLIEASDYATELARLLPKAHKRIVLAAMVIMSGPKTEEILRPLIAAAKRGVKVHVLHDHFIANFVTRPGNLDFSEFKKAVAETDAILSELQAAGGRVSVAGKLGLNPYGGRYHAKLAVVDDDVFSFGGVNLRDDCYDNIDYMLHATDNTLAGSLEQLIDHNAKGEPHRDMSLTLASGDTVLFDAGQKGQSIIYRRACELAKEARTITYVSQMAPTGTLAKVLAATKTTYFANRPRQTGAKPDALGQWFDQRTNGLHNHYEGKPYIHAKFILYELRSGQRIALTGSHNFSWRGVAFGTKEIALETANESVWKSLQEVVYKVATAD
jgi:cardiolipin synthase A/B